MAKSARQLIQDAGVTAGITDIFATFEPNEISSLLRQLNHIVEEFNTEEYFPVTKKSYTVDSITDSNITIGINQLNNAGVSNTYISGTITGLINTVNSVGTIPTFQDAVITLDTGEEILVPGISTMNAGILVGSDGGIYSNVPPGPSFTAPDITPDQTLSISTFNLNTLEGTFTNVDILAERPNIIESVAYLTDNRYVPLNIIDIDTYDNSVRLTQQTSTYPSYASYRTDYPIGTIELYPMSNTSTFNITVQDQLGPYEINDELNLPNGYIPALEYELAVRAAIINGYLDKVQLLKKLATDAKKKVKRLHAKPRLLNSGSAINNRGKYDIYTNSTYGRR